MSRFSFEQDNHGPFLWMNINSGEEEVRLRLDWETTSLFTHKNHDYFDHVFVEMSEVDDDGHDYQAMGAFIWRQVLPDWQDLANGLITHDFTHIHKPWPVESDIESYKRSGLIAPQANFIKPDKELIVIEEAEDTTVVNEAVQDIDHEISWFLNDPHYFDRIKPRKDDGE